MPENEEIKRKAEEAKEKKPALGPDLDLSKYSMEAEEHKKIGSLNELPENYKERSLETGVDPEGKERSGSFFQLDHSVICAQSSQEGLEVLNISDALNKYDWLKDKWWKAVSVDSDKFTAQAELKPTNGYFLRAKKGVKAIYPLQACLFIGKEGLAQNVHNIIIAEEGSELHIITGCTVAPDVRMGLHIGISEFYIEKNAKLTFTMIHNWAPEMDVRPRSGSIVEENGIFMSNYICLKSVKSLQMYPTTYLVGENSRARYNTITYGRGNSLIDTGARVYLRARNTRAELVARAIAKDTSQIYSRGHIIGEVPDIKAHLECRGLILSENAMIKAIPELEGKTANVDMSHEAAVGKIAEEEILYLMARGLSADEATSTIVRGFLRVDIEGLPEQLAREVKKMVDMEQLM